jgi:hypothetical protein
VLDSIFMVDGWFGMQGRGEGGLGEGEYCVGACELNSATERVGGGSERGNGGGPHKTVANFIKKREKFTHHSEGSHTPPRTKDAQYGAASSYTL